MMRKVFKGWASDALIPEQKRSWPVRYGSAVLAITAATLLRFPLNSLLGSAVPFILYFPAVLFAAWYSGFRAGILAAILGAFAARFFWMAPQFVWTIPNFSDGLQLTLFLLLSVFISGLTGMLHAAASSLQQAHIDIRTQAERFYVTLSSIGDAVIATDTDAKIQFMNPVAESLTGWKLAEAQGRLLPDIFKVVSEETGNPIDDPVQAVLQERRAVALANHTLLIAKNGSTCAVEDTAAPILDHGRLLGAVLVFHDVTARRDARRKLEEAHRRIEEIMSRMSDGFAVFDREWRYVYINDRAAEITGKTRDQLLGRRLWDLFPEEVGKPGHQQLTKAMNENVSVHFETFYEPFGKWFDLRGHPSAEGLALYIADITEKKNIQLAVTQELEKRVAEKTKELEERNISLEALSYGLAHDLRAPLRAIEGFSNILLNECGPTLDSQGKSFCQKIVSSAKHAEKLMTELLEYGRLAHAVIPLDTVELEAVVANVLRELDHEIRDKSAVVEVVRPLPPVLANGTVLEQTLTNLIGNALKFRRGALAPRIQIRAEGHNSSVKLHVTDNGVGIAPEDLEKIFKPFERLHSREQYPGTGLGLSIVQTGVERMGGHLGVESELGQGSTFWIELPRGDGELVKKTVV